MARVSTSRIKLLSRHTPHKAADSALYYFYSFCFCTLKFCRQPKLLRLWELCHFSLRKKKQSFCKQFVLETMGLFDDRFDGLNYLGADVVRGVAGLISALIFFTEMFFFYSRRFR